MDDEHALVLGGNELSDLLARAHPIRVRKALAETGRVVIENLEPFSHPHQALRFVYFVDKIYDNEITIAISSAITPFELFPGFLRAGGDNKKYSRATSRLVEMTNGG